MSAKDDFVRLRHMLDAAREAVSFVQNKTRRDLDQDRKLVLSLLRLIEIVGEAASQITRGFQETHSEIPWPQIIAMRNRLIHAYFDVDLDRVWDTVNGNLPSLVAELEKIVPPES